MVTPESQILSGCLRYLNRAGIFHWRNNVGAVRVSMNRWVSFGLKGSSDILAVLPPAGRILCIECKSKTGRLSPEQEQFIGDITRLGGLAVVVRDWRELDTVLRREGFINDPLFESVPELTL